MSIVYSAECVASQKKSRPATLLPLLVILFIVSYGILTLLVFEQGRTIESQRFLIRGMLQDSTQLASLKGKLAREESNRSHDKAGSTGGAQRRGFRQSFGRQSCGGQSFDRQSCGRSKRIGQTNETTQ